MKNIAAFIIFISLNLSTNVFSQTSQQPSFDQQLKAEESLQFIAKDLQEIAKSVTNLNKSVVETYNRMLSSKGLSLSENQQKLLVSFEILNRSELRLATLQKLRIELVEKQTSVQAQIGQIEDQLRNESIDRSIAIRGTTNAEELRENRRKTLNSQKNGLSNLLTEIQETLSETDVELRQTKDLVRDLRMRLFPAIYRELPKLDYDN